MMYLQEEGQVNVQGWFKMGGRITEEWGGSSPVTDREDEHWINQTLFISLQNQEGVGDHFMSGSFRCKLKGFHFYSSSLGTNKTGSWDFSQPLNMSSPEPRARSRSRFYLTSLGNVVSGQAPTLDERELVKLVESWFLLSSSLRTTKNLTTEFINSTWNGIIWLVSSQPRTPTAYSSVRQHI